MEDFWVFCILGVVGLLFLILLFKSYVKAPPDTAFVISGLSREPKVIIGKASFRIPFLQRVDKLPLELVSVDVKTSSSVPTNDYINIVADGVANVQVDFTSADLVRIAAKNFLNRGTEYIGQVAQQILEGSLREIIGQMRLSNLVTQRDEFSKSVEGNASKDMARMGLRVTNFNIQNFKDDNGVITDLGIDNVAQIQKNAKIARANAAKEVAVQEAVASEEANRARVNADTLISEQQKELAIRRAQFKSEQDREQALADSAFAIQQQLQQKVINENEVEAQIARAEREQKLRTQEIDLRQKELEASVIKVADAAKYEKERAAEAELYQAKAQADAKRYAAEQDAAAAKARLIAEAEGEKEKLLAQAQGEKAILLAQAEGIRAKAEAQKLMGEASVLEMAFQALPQVAKNIAEPLNNVDAITMYGEGNSSGFVGDMSKGVAKVFSVVQDATGLDLGKVIRGFAEKKAEEEA
jgi:flotillin